MHRASSSGTLLAGLGELLRDPLPDPFTPEVVAVPTRGVERWIAQSLAGVLGAGAGGTDGVCANVEFPFPGRLLERAAAGATGRDPDEQDPWSPARSVWRLLEVVDAGLAEPELATLAAHLGHDRDPDDPRSYRRFAAVRHLADLFDRYGVHRPAMIAAWAAGDDTDGAGHALPADLAWQAWLWRRLAVAMGTPSPAERLPELCRQLAEDPAATAGLPPRLSLFGLTRLPDAHLQLLAALATRHDVHLWLLHLSAAGWAARRDLRRGPRPPGGADGANRLLRTWGRDSAELQVLISAHPHADEALDDPPPPPSVLGRLQADIRADRSSPGDPDRRVPLSPDDRSLQVHACHGQARQVEVLRDAIAHLLCDDPTLEPRDVVVMCPDIETFAPLIEATFGAAASVTHRDLHVRLADRSIRQTNPLFGAVSLLLEMASSRAAASEVLDFASTGPVRRRFELDDDDLARLAEWSRDAGVRWGLDAASRRPYEMADIAAGTWAAGMDRMLLGVAMSEEGLHRFGSVLPLDDVDSGDIDLLGRIAELVDRLARVLDDLRSPAPPAVWLDRLRSAADDLTATVPADAWQRLQFDQTIDDVRAEAAGSTAELSLSELRALLADRLRGRPTRANFRTGHLTMCTLVPMRSVPHRVVCLLGLDDGVFPRHNEPDGDDVIARRPFVGDPDPRSEDRQLLLDALLAAGDHLVITYRARDERTNGPRPPAVPLGELLDTVDRTFLPPPGRDSALDAIVVHHPLQPFAADNFVAGQLIGDGAWSFDPVALAGATAARDRQPAPRAHLAGAPPLPWLSRDPVDLADLVRFVQHPVRAFLRQRLGISLAGDEPEPDDGLPLDLDGLARWAVGDRLLRARLHGIEPATAAAAELARGELPPGELGRAVVEGLLGQVEALVSAADGAVTDARRRGPTADGPTADGPTADGPTADGPAAGTGADGPADGPGTGTGAGVAVEVDARLPSGRYVLGNAGPVYGEGDAPVLRTVLWSRLGPKHRMADWTRLLALTVTDPERPWRAVTIGRGGGGRSGAVAIAGLPPLGADPEARNRVAGAALDRLIELYDRGLREPLPLPCETAAAWAEARRLGKDPYVVARSRWQSDYDFPREDRDVEHQFVYGGVHPWDLLVATAPAADETGPGWVTSEDCRLGRLARRLWDDLLLVEDRR